MSTSTDDRHPLFLPLVVLGGLIQGFGLAYSGMARPEIVLDFLQFDDLGLVFVMGGAAVVSGVVFGVGWGISGICPGAAYASLGVGNVTILWALAGMFIGAYAQGYWRATTTSESPPSVARGD